MEPRSVGSAQFVTDADWYSADAPGVARFVEKWGPGADEEGSRSTANADGALKLDVRTLWPPQQQIMVATAPEQHDVDKQLTYAVRGDGRTLAEGKFGAWILGQADIDVPLEGIKTLEVETRVDHSKKLSLLWANARIVTRDGTEHTLKELAELPPEERAAVLSTSNVAPGPERMDADYFGGPIKIAGTAYGTGLPAEPKDAAQPAVSTFHLDVSGLDAVRFKATLGSDYPPGPEDQRRKVYAVRAPEGATSARFLTIIEPYEDRPVVKSAEALGADRLRVELADGRVQEITLGGLEGDGHDVSLKISESRGRECVARGSDHRRRGAVMRAETFQVWSPPRRI